MQVLPTRERKGVPGQPAPGATQVLAANTSYSFELVSRIPRQSCGVRVLLTRFPKRRVRKVKLLWALGGCLGARSRRRARRTAKGHGEQRACFDPWVPECGNAAAMMGRHPPREGGKRGN
jgi:hypothetical protein